MKQYHISAKHRFDSSYRRAIVGGRAGVRVAVAPPLALRRLLVLFPGAAQRRQHARDLVILRGVRICFLLPLQPSIHRVTCS